MKTKRQERSKSKTKSAKKKKAAERLVSKKIVKKKKKLSKTLEQKVATENVSKTSTKKAKKKSAKKTVWKVSPEKYGVTDQWVFKKDDVTIDLSQNYRFSYLIVANKPTLAKYDPKKGVDIDKFKWIHIDLGDDARGPDWNFPDSFSLEEQERIESLWDVEYDDAMTAAGWSCAMETYFYGDLSVEEVEPEYPFDPV